MSVGVKVKDGNLEKALSRFKRKVKNSKIMLDYKKNQYYTKPSKKRRTAKHKSEQRRWDAILATPGSLDERAESWPDYMEEIEQKGLI